MRFGYVNACLFQSTFKKSIYRFFFYYVIKKSCNGKQHLIVSVECYDSVSARLIVRLKNNI